jgi:hypothetical protein
LVVTGKLVRRERLQHVADLCIAGYLVYRKQALAIPSPFALFYAALMGMKRQQLHKKRGFNRILGVIF